MSSSLSAIPVATRRRVAATLGLFTALFAAVGAVSLTGRSSAAAPVFAGVALFAALVLGLIAWGLVRSSRLDEAEQSLDAAIESTVRAHGGQLCDCGHEHDPGELHITDACAHDGAGEECAHDCRNCVLSALRPSPHATRAQRTG